MNKIQSIATLLLCLLASACSLTRNLPEGETLYRGIKSIDYDKHREAETGGQEKGVITALADAYTTVEGLLSGDAIIAAESTEHPMIFSASLRVTLFFSIFWFVKIIYIPILSATR